MSAKPPQGVMAADTKRRPRLSSKDSNSRLLRGGPKVISTGGGAFINDNTRRHISRGGISLWLKADLEVLWERVNKRDHRPLLKTENPRATLAALMEKRYPIYSEADLTIESRDVRKEIIVTEVLAAIAGIEQKD